MAHQVQQMAYVGETPGMASATNSLRSSPSKSGRNSPAVSFQILETPVRFMAESAGPLGSIKPSPIRKCCIAQTRRMPCRLFPTVIRSSSPVRFWSSTATSRKWQATNWKPPGFEGGKVLGTGANRSIISVEG